ncbi:MAG: YbhB/YbcL family Raf kinase inhibitor-like protein, partial [Myxococcales bacterium]
ALGAGSPGGITGSAVQGTNDYGKTGYGGPCPPAGAAAHHYQFTLYALKVPDLKAAAGIPDNATGGLVGFATRANATAQASFTATYGR